MTAERRWGVITTVAGTGAAGYSGDGGPATAARLRQPFHVAFDHDGNLLIVEAENHVVRRVRRDTGRIETLVGSGRRGYGGDGGPAVAASLNEPYAVAVDPGGDLYVADRLNACVRRVDVRTGVITTVAGNGTPGFSGDNGPGRRAQLREPNDCAVDAARGRLLIADVGDSRVRALDLRTGTLSTWGGTGRRAREGDGGPVGAAAFDGARAVAVDGRDGTVYVCEREGNAVRRVDGRTTIVTRFAGTGRAGYEGDGGPAGQATFRGPKGVRCDRSGNLFVIDTENHAIRRICAATGNIVTVAGGARGAWGDGGSARLAGLDRPHGCAVGPDGALYIADSNNHRVRRVAPTAAAPAASGRRQAGTNPT
jgi:hypothetical protein